MTQRCNQGKRPLKETQWGQSHTPSFIKKITFLISSNWLKAEWGLLFSKCMCSASSDQSPGQTGWDRLHYLDEWTNTTRHRLSQKQVRILKEHWFPHTAFEMMHRIHPTAAPDVLATHVQHLWKYYSLSLSRDKRECFKHNYSTENVTGSNRD